MNPTWTRRLRSYEAMHLDGRVVPPSEWMTEYWYLTARKRTTTHHTHSEIDSCVDYDHVIISTVYGWINGIAKIVQIACLLKNKLATQHSTLRQMDNRANLVTKKLRYDNNARGRYFRNTQLNQMTSVGNWLSDLYLLVVPHTRCFN